LSFNFGQTQTANLKTVTLAIQPVDIFMTNFEELHELHKDWETGAYKATTWDNEKMEATYEWVDSSKLEADDRFQEALKKGKEIGGNKLVIILTDKEAILFWKNPNLKYIAF
jgi:hypothetical protein